MSPTRLLSIGEFSAATQLSPKALRIYDEQQLLPPAFIDANNGYRFYNSDQVPKGRLVRTLREMGLSLVDISFVLGSKTTPEALLSRFAKQQDLRHAREKRAFHSALSMIRHSTFPEPPGIRAGLRTGGVIAVREFFAARHAFVERFHVESDALNRDLIELGVATQGVFRCALTDPLTEESGRLETIVAVTLPAPPSPKVVLRELPASPFVALTMNDRRAHASELSSALDALFDWFDRRGHQAVGAPLLQIDRDDGSFAELEWAYSTN